MAEGASARGAPASRAATMPGGFWCSCRPSITSAYRAEIDSRDERAGSGHCARVPRAARFHRRGHHPHCGGRTSKEDIVSDLVFSTGLDRHPPEVESSRARSSCIRSRAWS